MARPVKAWVTLGIAILAEIAGTSALKASDGMTRLWPAAVVIVGYAIAFWCMSIAIRTIPVGIAYAVWSGVGIVLITAIGWALYGQKLDIPALAGLALIIAGVALVNLFRAPGG